MQTNTKNRIVLASTDEIDLAKTFECGQCFRWNADDNGVYTGVASGKVLSIWREKDKIICNAKDEDVPFWRDYFDLDVNYSEKSSLFTDPPYLKECAEYGAGIKILRQEPWEALCSFIISQCNNIPRIKKIIAVLCENFGEELDYGRFSFPSAERLVGLEENDLASLRCGYRASYIINAVRSVSSGTIDFEVLSKLPSEESFSKVKQIQGVGDKVANCFMLYGLHRMDRFPIDVWMRRALNDHFPKNFDPTVLGSFAGLAQQYIFYFERSHGHFSQFECS